MIFMKFIRIVATRFQIFSAKCTKFHFGRGTETVNETQIFWIGTQTYTKCSISVKGNRYELNDTSF